MEKLEEVLLLNDDGTSPIEDTVVVSIGNIEGLATLIAAVVSDPSLVLGC